MQTKPIDVELLLRKQAKKDTIYHKGKGLDNDDHCTGAGKAGAGSGRWDGLAGYCTEK